MKSFHSHAFALSIAALLSFGFTSTVYAKKAPTNERVLTATTAEEFGEQAATLRKQMNDGRFAGIAVGDRAIVERELEVIAGLLQKSGPLDGMNDNEKVNLINAQETANAILTRNDDDRLVCEMRRPTGSNFKQKQCITIGDARRLREQTREGLDGKNGPLQPATP